VSGAREERVASHGKGLPSGQRVPQHAAPPAGDGRPTLASRKRLPSRQLRITHWQGTRSSGAGACRESSAGAAFRHPEGLAKRGLGMASDPKARSRRHTQEASRSAHRGRPPEARVDSMGSSDMLPWLNGPEIPRGFAFSVTCMRRCLPAAEAARSHGRSGASRHAGTWTGHEPGRSSDRVRGRTTWQARTVPAATPDGGARGGAPSAMGTRGRADRHATRPSRLGFRSEVFRRFAARGLHHCQEEWSIGVLRAETLDRACCL
jgi:hypothetical protein